MTDGQLIDQLRMIVDSEIEKEVERSYAVFQAGPADDAEVSMVVVRFVGVTLDDLDIDSFAAKLKGESHPDAIFGNKRKENIVVIEGQLAGHVCEVWIRVCG